MGLPLIFGAIAAAGLGWWLLRKDAGSTEPEYNAPPAELAAQESGLGFDFATIYRIVGTVGERSSGYGALNRNDAGKGISFGLIQHNQGGGNLGRMLSVWHDTDGPGFARVWGDLGAGLLAATNAATLAERLAINLAAEPYLSRWAAAGREPGCQAAQAYTARTSYLTTKILAACEAHGLRGTRPVGLVFDRAVNQGNGAALASLGKVPMGLGTEEALGMFVNACMDRLDEEHANRVADRWSRVDNAFQAAGAVA
jgi:hypothetical protein